jgi:uncharacterized protein
MQKNLLRKLYFTLIKHVNEREMIVFTGMRRVGKSSLLQMVFDSISSSNKLILDIESPNDRAAFEEKDYNNIIKNLSDLGLNANTKMYVFLDEIQSYPEIVIALKYLYDHYDIKFFITGSSSFYLKNLFPESLSDRKLEFEMYPLDFDEFLFFKGEVSENELYFKTLHEKQNSKVLFEKRIRYYDEYMLYGGFPQVVLASDSGTKKMFLNDIFKSYFQTDLLKLLNMKSIGHLRNLIILLTARIGNKVDISRLASELGVTRETVYNYISFLQGSYFFHFVSRYGKSTDKEISSLQKVYICDNGIASQIAKLSEGQILENAVFLNLRKYGIVNYYHDKSQKEIDFVIPGNELALEVKRTAIQTDVSRLNNFVNKIALKNSLTITYNYSEMEGTLAGCFL